MNPYRIGVIGLALDARVEIELLARSPGEGGWC